MNQDKEYISDEQFERELTHAVHLEERARMRSFIDDLESKFQQSAPSEARVRPMPQRKWFLLAASFLLLAAAYFTFQTLSGPNAMQVAAAYYEPYPNGYEPVVRSSNTPASTEMSALSAYESENYELALKTFSSLDEPNENIRLFMAICAIETGDLESAGNMLVKLRKEVPASNVLSNPIDWYSGIVSLMKNEKDAAMSYFQKLAAQKNDSIYSRDSAKLIKELH